ncbi:hypothetical protein Tco_0758179 [Tanacetum coccineum]
MTTPQIPISPVMNFLSLLHVFDIQNHGPMTTPQIPITATGRVAAKYLRQNHAENISTKTVQIPMTVTGKKLGQNHGENIPTTTQMKIGVTREGLDLKLSKGLAGHKEHSEESLDALNLGDKERRDMIRFGGGVIRIKLKGLSLIMSRGFEGYLKPLSLAHWIVQHSLQTQKFLSFFPIKSAGDCIPDEDSPATIPQRHLAGESPEMLLGKTPIVVVIPGLFQKV